MGLKSVTSPWDVFAAYRYADRELHPESLDAIGDPAFLENFRDLYKYYKDTTFKRFARLGPPYRSRRSVLTSARRWERDGWWRRTARNWWTCARFLLGVSPDRLVAAYVSEGRAPRRAGSGTR